MRRTLRLALSLLAFLTAPDSDELPADLGRALTRIHSVDVADARAAGLREVEWDSHYSGPLHFIHADFRDGNLIVHPHSGRLVGVIDWGNSAASCRASRSTCEPVAILIR